MIRFSMPAHAAAFPPPGKALRQAFVSHAFLKGLASAHFARARPRVNNREADERR
jgi:hypothetical protein